MKEKVSHLVVTVNNYKIWFLILLFLNILYGLLVWLQNTETFWQLFPVMVIGTVGLYMIAVWVCYTKDMKRASCVTHILQNNEETVKIPDDDPVFSDEEKKMLDALRDVVQVKNDQLHQQMENMNAYHTFTEAWAHEIKTPLALMTLVLDNRKEEISEEVYRRLQYGCQKIQDDVEKMLYYGRLQSNCTDFLFEPINLKYICDSVMDEYSNLLSERKIHIENHVMPLQVFTDKRGLKFCLRQVITNAIQYMDDKKDKRICMYTVQDQAAGKIVLSVKDNGTGVNAYDRPFIFQKGFTGDKGSVNQTATGMGLYLTSEMARHLKIELEIPECQEGFEISFIFNL